MAVATLSDYVQQVVSGERELVASRLDALRDQSARLHELVERVDADVEETRRLLRRMDEMLGIAPQLSFETQGELRGQKLQAIAVQLLREREVPGTVVHYRDWYQLVLDAGVRVCRP